MNKNVEIKMKNKRIKKATSLPINNEEADSYSIKEAVKKAKERREKRSSRDKEGVVHKRKYAKRIKKEDIDLIVPFAIASKINKDIDIKKEQRDLRKQLSVFIGEHFGEFIDDYRRLEAEPALRARLFVEIVKIVLPRQRETDDVEVLSERDKLVKRLFGNQRIENVEIDEVKNDDCE